jgi:hypothetical protein
MKTGMSRQAVWGASWSILATTILSVPDLRGEETETFTGPKTKISAATIPRTTHRDRRMGELCLGTDDSIKKLSVRIHKNEEETDRLATSTIQRVT